MFFMSTAVIFQLADYHYLTYLPLYFHLCSMTNLKECSGEICYISTAKDSWNAADET